jgi:hypothetical protein
LSPLLPDALFPALENYGGEPTGSLILLENVGHFLKKIGRRECTGNGFLLEFDLEPIELEGPFCQRHIVVPVFKKGYGQRVGSGQEPDLSWSGARFDAYFPLRIKGED